MHNLETFSLPIVELLRHVIVVDLMENDVEFVHLGQDRHFELPAPGSIPRHQPDVLVNAHIILHVELVLFLVGPQVIADLPAQLDMLILIAEQLVSNRAEKAISVAFVLLKPESFFLESNFEFGQINPLLLQHCCSAIILNCAIHIVLSCLLFFRAASLFIIFILSTGRFFVQRSLFLLFFPLSGRLPCIDRFSGGDVSATSCPVGHIRSSSRSSSRVCSGAVSWLSRSCSNCCSFTDGTPNCSGSGGFSRGSTRDCRVCRLS